jgi:hypothetical protein
MSAALKRDQAVADSSLSAGRRETILMERGVRHDADRRLSLWRQAVWGYYKPEDVVILSAEHDSTYSASGMNQHHFCTRCGGNTHGSSPDWASMYNNDGTLKEGQTQGVPTKRIMAINLRMVDDLDLSTLDVEKVDGRKSW